MVELRIRVQCPACGAPLSSEGGSAGLCPGCLFELALDDTALEAELLVGADEAPTVAFAPEHVFSEGDIHGERYRIRSLLGRGGMGEVWRAYDLKLRLDVALKALRTELVADEGALETLRREVRVAREVISPNVCRVFDLEELDGRELVSMEYVDGTTLQEILRERGPLELNEAREIAAQFLAGLEAIHAAGLVHRDIKPENLMLTRTGRVVVMDFGIAKGLGKDQGGLVAGTPAYMAPEQARGDELDARSDLFAAGVVLAEMVEPGGMGSFEDRRRVWEGIHRERPEISDTPWSQVITKAVAPQVEDRFGSASALARALEEVTLRAAGDESARPYPGLSAFQEEDAEYFYGRELELEALWKKLRRPHLMAVIGPSGAGKSSFLRAGLLPTLTDGWGAILTTPGSRPFAHLARALAEQLPEDRETVDLLLRIEEPEVAIDLISQWREGYRYGLLILDQFEELFTQAPEETQAAFAGLLGVLPLRADVHVLLAMRDDFLLRCSDFDSLAPVFSELSPLKGLSGASLRRAIVQPALKCGYRFEEEGIVEEMLAEVEGERGSLPLVAFTAAQLWDERDRDTGLLTRAAYGSIGGVGGALAQHAEATLEKIGEERIPIVRELFRNLVTAQGTRAARDRDELLSVFEAAGASGSVASPNHAPRSPEARRPPTPTAPEPRSGAAMVLDALIDARLLTSYEVPPADDHDTVHHRIEIIHESLLTAWPRLVRWQMQDAEGAKLRDELRHQAALWQEHGRTDDYLWTGAAYLDFLAWRQRYPGGLTKQEEVFGEAMARHAERRKRRRRLAAAAAFTLLLTVLVVVGTLWRQSERARAESEVARAEALAEARRAEAAKLLALAQLRFEEDPTEALAYATVSLELSDTNEARRFALRILTEAPPAFGLDLIGTHHQGMEFSPDQRHLAVAGNSDVVAVYAAEGGPPVILPGHTKSGIAGNHARWISNEILVTGHLSEGLARVWSFPSGELVRQIDVGGPAWFPQEGEDRFFAEVMETDAESGHELYRLRAFRVPEGELEELGVVDLTALGPGFKLWSFVDRGGRGWIYPRGNEIFYRPLPVQEGVPDRFLGRHENEAVYGSRTSPENRFWTRDAVTSELRLWDLSSPTGQPAKVARRPAGLEDSTWRPVGFSERWARASIQDSRNVRLWDLDSWSEARPLELRRSGSWLDANVRIAPRGDWLVGVLRNRVHLAFWPINRTWPRIVDGYRSYARFVVFSPDGLWLATNEGYGDSLRLWPLPGNDSQEVRSVTLPEEHGWMNCAFDPRGRYLFVVGALDRPYIVPLDGSPPRKLESFSEETMTVAAAVSPSGGQVATAFGQYAGPKTLRVWNLESGELRLYDLPETATPDTNVGVDKVSDLAFADETTLYMAGDGGVRRWDLESGTHELVLATQPGYGAVMRLAADGRTALVAELPLGGEELSSLRLLDLASGEERPLPEFGEVPRKTTHPFDIDDSGTVVASADTDGMIRVGRIGGGEPHLLIGHDGRAGVTISPDGRWVASAGDDNTLRLWPMPDLDKPPLHTLLRDELIAKLESLTNLRAVRDPESPEGWTFTLDPFPGWKDMPEW